MGMSEYLITIDGKYYHDHQDREIKKKAHEWIVMNCDSDYQLLHGYGKVSRMKHESDVVRLLLSVGGLQAVRCIKT
jgi:hypothetical protein